MLHLCNITYIQGDILWYKRDDSLLRGSFTILREPTPGFGIPYMDVWRVDHACHSRIRRCGSPLHAGPDCGHDLHLNGHRHNSEDYQRIIWENEAAVCLYEIFLRCKGQNYLYAVSYFSLFSIYCDVLAYFALLYIPTSSYWIDNNLLPFIVLVIFLALSFFFETIAATIRIAFVLLFLPLICLFRICVRILILQIRILVAVCQTRGFMRIDKFQKLAGFLERTLSRRPPKCGLHECCDSLSRRTEHRNSLTIERESQIWIFSDLFERF